MWWRQAREEYKAKKRILQTGICKLPATGRHTKPCSRREWCEVGTKMKLDWLVTRPKECIVLYTFHTKSQMSVLWNHRSASIWTPSFKDAPGQVEVVAAGKSWAASPHLYAYQPAHFSLPRGAAWPRRNDANPLTYCTGLSVLWNGEIMGLAFDMFWQSKLNTCSKLQMCHDVPILSILREQFETGVAM